ncbi:AAA family ATPase [Desulfurispira natronophila]|uniref:Putative ATPase n=1 Tax=Desulfurispira natronophila TaxID=682562 RepID=A0A7W8DHW1_9BACT|nr:AAA family ATPase [Desulfurispira natronophila]MBB5022859.1 putative ATPase [Desulfurispira natronophila]
MQRLIDKIQIRDLLSFDAKGVSLELRNLNVLIGPNGCGKSNFIEAISLLQSAPGYLASPVKDSGGISVWLHRGSTKPVALIDVTTGITSKKFSIPIRHAIAFTEVGNRFELQDELIEDATAYDGSDTPYFYYRYQNNRPVLNVNEERRTLQRVDIDPEQSILSQRKDPDQYPEITQMGREYQKIRIYREWSFGRYSMPRLPQKADGRNDYLEENYQNLGLILNKILKHPRIKKKLLEKLQLLYPRFEDYNIIVEGATVQIFFTESDYSIPATRLSDGTLRFLSLLAALYGPDKPSLLCIEEPELGLHPDILPAIAEILKEVSEETQLVVTTHSDIIIDALSDRPEDVIVCENRNGSTTMQRLCQEDLALWLEKYSLGELWSKGEIGGNRF